MTLRAVLCLAAFLLFAAPALASSDCAAPAGICRDRAEGGFALIERGRPAAVLVAETDHAGVVRAAGDLRADLAVLAGREGALVHAAEDAQGGAIVIVGALDRSPLIRALADEGKLDISGLEGAWEGFVQQVVDAPLPGVERALVIAGSDKRGAIFGAYDLAERAGVSPWAWWADVPVARKREIYVASGRRFEKPAVRYRGIFINDENPALYGWVNETFGGFNHKFYERVYELILRMKGNYLWPAMWGKALYDDDPQNAPLADEMGVVIGTSHHEPMMRAHVEWERYGEGPWDYTKNAETLRAFWREGIERMGDNESIVTIGMRGDGDEPMTEGTAISLLERIVADQRGILEEVTGEPASKTPQIWALYKEVQDYYDAGMDVPEDVTLLFADDNWGNIRRLPAPDAAREGGYGVYYHFDYVGGPRNYKWLNTNQIERVWEQMKLAYDYGAREIWIVNVGDIKPMEFPTEFFLDLAWNPDAYGLAELADYPRAWSAQQFGDKHAEDIGELLTRYSQFSARRKPELIDADSFSAIHFREWDRIVEGWESLADRADTLRRRLPKAHDDAFVQLVWYPVHASANLNALYRATALNRLYAGQGRASANDYADEVAARFAHNDELDRIYHEDVADGKWPHMMSQTRIGYTYWQQPDENVMPRTVRVEPVQGPSMAVAVEGDARAWPGADGAAQAPRFDSFSDRRFYIDLINRGDAPFRFEARPGAPWIRLSTVKGTVEKDRRIEVFIDWARAPAGESAGEIVIEGAGARVPVAVRTFNPDRADVAGFVETDGVVAIEAPNYARAENAGEIEWRVIPELSRTLGAVAAFPTTAAPSAPGEGPFLEYDVWLWESGEVSVELALAPTLDFKGQAGLSYAVSIDDEAPVVVNVHEDESLRAWERSVASNAHLRQSRHVVDAPGLHKLRIWRVDPGLVFQRIVVARKPAPRSYLGPPESPRAATP